MLPCYVSLVCVRLWLPPYRILSVRLYLHVKCTGNRMICRHFSVLLFCSFLYCLCQRQRRRRRLTALTPHTPRYTSNSKCIMFLARIRWAAKNRRRKEKKNEIYSLMRIVIWHTKNRVANFHEWIQEQQKSKAKINFFSVFALMQLVYTLNWVAAPCWTRCFVGVWITHSITAPLPPQKTTTDVNRVLWKLIIICLRIHTRTGSTHLMRVGTCSNNVTCVII